MSRLIRRYSCFKTCHKENALKPPCIHLVTLKMYFVSPQGSHETLPAHLSSSVAKQAKLPESNSFQASLSKKISFGVFNNGFGY